MRWDGEGHRNSSSTLPLAAAQLHISVGGQRIATDWTHATDVYKRGSEARRARRCPPAATSPATDTR